MERLFTALGILAKALGAILVTLVSLGLILAVLGGWSESNTERASYECTVRRMDHHIAAEDTGAYHDTCMAAVGYRRVGACYSGNLIAAPAFCFAPGWQAWR